MPVHIISDLTGLFLVAVGEPVSYTPYATESPTSWACTGLPSGVSINTTSGLISGAPSAAGISTCSLTATNGTGTSAPLIFIFNAIAAPLADEGLIDLNYDLQTGIVVNPKITDGPQSYGKSGDVLGYNIGFVRNDALRIVDVTNIKATLRDSYDTKAITLYDAAPRSPLDLAAPRYSILFTLTGDEIVRAVNEHAQDGDAGIGKNYELGAKIELEFTLDLGSAIDGVSEIKRTTVSFGYHLAKSLD